MANKKSEYYINNNEFKEEITQYYSEFESGNEDIPAHLGVKLLKIANGLSFAGNFINYSFKDEMIGDALVKMVQALQNRKYDITSDYAPFAYFTTIAYHAFVNRIKKEGKQKDIVDAYQEKVYNDLLSEQCIDCEGTAQQHNGNSDDHDY